MNLTRVYLNFTALSIPTQWEMTKAKRAYRDAHPECAICGNRKYLEVHHVIPVHVDHTLACDLDNFITLCDPKNNGCHRWFGHFGNFRSKWNLEIREFAIKSRYHLEKMEPERKFLVPTEQLIEEFSLAMFKTEREFLASL
jgi:hypothetical protein